MAELILEDGVGCFYWQITGLGSPFNKDNYVEVGITRNSFTSGTTNDPGRIDWVTAPASGNDNGIDVQEALLDPGTYTIYGYAKTDDSGWVRYWAVDAVDSSEVTVKAPNTRPDDWGWWSTKKEGQPVKIRANEWMHFVECIDAFRAYKGLGPYGFTYVSPGDDIGAKICNEARSAISSIPGHGTLPSKAVKDNSMGASFFNKLRDALNAVE